MLAPASCAAVDAVCQLSSKESRSADVDSEAVMNAPNFLSVTDSSWLDNCGSLSEQVISSSCHNRNRASHTCCCLSL